MDLVKNILAGWQVRQCKLASEITFRQHIDMRDADRIFKAFGGCDFGDHA